jgi:sirohydrochlorin ferrochelatase
MLRPARGRLWQPETSETDVKLRSLFAATALLLGAAAPLAGQGTAGTLIVAHGGDEGWNARVADIAGQVRTGGPVEYALLMGPGAAAHRFQDAAARLAAKGAREIVVVPLLVSSHSGHYEQIRWLAGATDSLDGEMMHHLHMSGLARPSLPGVRLRVARAIDASPELARVLAGRARALATEPAGQALFLLGHGPNESEEYAAWMENLRPVADSVRRLAGMRDVKVGLVRDDAPAAVRAEAVRGIREMIELQHAATGKPVVVVPILVSAGGVSRGKFPRDLEGLPVVYGGEPLLPHPEMARWIEGRVREPGTVAAGGGR